MDRGPIEIAELFDPAERIDRFVFLLYETLADLGTMESRMKGNLYGEGTSVAQTLYLQRHLAARVEDSWRVVAAIRDHDDVAQFVADAGAKEEADWLRAQLTKSPDSEEKTPVQKLMQADRQRTIHLAEVDSPALRETLEKAAEAVVEIAVYEDRRVIEFPELAITVGIFGDLNSKEAKAAFAARAAMIESVLRKFRALSEKCLDLHLVRRRIGHDRLFVHRR